MVNYLENENFKATIVVNDPTIIVLGFGGLGAVKKEGGDWGEGFFQSKGFSFVSLNPKSEHWWFRGCFGEELEKLQSITRSYQRVVCYGHSMGGHGAFVHADDLNATSIISSAPQYSINPNIIGKYDRRWSQFFSAKIHDGMEDRLKSHASDIRIIFDPFDKTEKWHVDRIMENNPQTNTLRLPFTEHEPLQFLKSAGLLSDVIGSLIVSSGVPKDIRLKVRQARATSDQYVRRMRKVLDWREQKSLLRK